MSHSTDICEVARLLRSAGSVLFITGAGLSADSGLPTYRGVGGLYDDAETEEGFPIEVALSGPMFQRRPAITWKYLWQVGVACAGASPNAAHQFMARLEAEKPNVWVLTQNVDGLHRKAGSKNLIEAHGHGFDLYCTRCRKEYHADDLLNGYRETIELPPRCRVCQGVIRPHVVLFEEALPVSVQTGFKKLAAMQFQMVFSVGTSALFPYIAGPVFDARKQSIPTVEINPDETDLSDLFSHRIRMTAAAAIQAIEREM